MIGKAWSHAPDSGVETEGSLALVTSSVALWRRCSKDDLTTSEFQALWDWDGAIILKTNVVVSKDSFILFGDG